MMRSISLLILGACGWSVDPDIPPQNKFVLVGAPHTSNWDFPFAMLARIALEVDFRWVGKHTLFHWPLGGFMRALGGVPVDRSAGAGFVEATVAMFDKNDHFVLVISPEGTRSRTEYWRSGFYQIAMLAGVPVALGYIDYRRKRIGIGAVFTPCGEIDRDFHIIRDFYMGIPGWRPQNQGEIRLKPSQSA